MADVKLGIDLSKYPTLARFSNSDAYIRMLIGPAGSLKTSYCFNEILRLACLQEPNEQGVRPSRWVVIRNTFEVLKRATMSTCKFNIPEPLLRYTEGNTPIAKGSFLLPDGTTVSLQIDFLAVDTVDVLGKLLGYDYTGAMCDELTELDEEIILAAARRAGREEHYEINSFQRSPVGRQWPIGPLNLLRRRPAPADAPRRCAPARSGCSRLPGN